MGKGRRWAWLGALVVNVVAIPGCVTGNVLIAIDPDQVEGLLSFIDIVFGLPIIAISGAAVVLLLQPPVRRYYWPSGRGGEAVGSVTPPRLGSLT